MTTVRENVYIEAPYVQAVVAFESRLGLETGQETGRSMLTVAASVADRRQITRDVTMTARRVPGTANFTSQYRVGWPGGQTSFGIPTPGFEGMLTLRAGEDYRQCELDLEGDYEPPGGAAGKLFDEIVGRRIAHATLGSLLRGVRRALRESYEGVEAAKHAG